MASSKVDNKVATSDEVRPDDLGLDRQQANLMSKETSVRPVSPVAGESFLNHDGRKEDVDMEDVSDDDENLSKMQIDEKEKGANNDRLAAGLAEGLKANEKFPADVLALYEAMSKTIRDTWWKNGPQAKDIESINKQIQSRNRKEKVSEQAFTFPQTFASFLQTYMLRKIEIQKLQNEGKTAEASSKSEDLLDRFLISTNELVRKGIDWKKFYAEDVSKELLERARAGKSDNSKQAENLLTGKSTAPGKDVAYEVARTASKDADEVAKAVEELPDIPKELGELTALSALDTTFTDEGELMHVQKIGKYGRRGILRIGTNDFPVYITMTGSDLMLDERFDEDLKLPDVDKRREEKHIKGIKGVAELRRKDGKSIFFIMVVFHNDQDINPHQNLPFEQMMTKSRMLTFCRKRFVEKKLKESLAKATKLKPILEKYREKNVDPDTKKPLDPSDFDSRPWLFRRETVV